MDDGIMKVLILLLLSSSISLLAQPSTSTGRGGSGSGVVGNTFNVLDGDNIVFNEANLGTIANGGTATLTLTTNTYRAIFSGATATIALPSITITTNSYQLTLFGTNTSGGSQIITIPSIIREEFNSITPITTFTNNTSAAWTFIAVSVGGVWQKAYISGDALTYPSLAASNIFSGGQLPIGTLAPTNGAAFQVLGFDGTERIWESVGIGLTNAGNTALSLNMAAGTNMVLTTNGNTVSINHNGVTTSTNADLGYGYIRMTVPNYADGTGAIISTTANSAAYNQAAFSSSAATNGNWAAYLDWVPADMNSAVELEATIGIRLSANDTAQQKYSLGMLSCPASSAANGAQTASSNFILFNFTDAAGAGGDAEYTTVTLTGWAAALTPNTRFQIALARDGTDASTQASQTMFIVIKYKKL